MSEKKNTPPSTVDTQALNQSVDGSTWLQKAREAYRQSTSYVDANYRARWEDSLAMFNNEHPGGSKYNSPQFDKRSKLFRPKTRAVIRKNEAASAAAFFSNADIVAIDAQNPSNPQEVVSATIMKELLAWRLTNSIPWFQIVQGGIQDAQTQGVVCAHIYWKHTTKNVARIQKEPQTNNQSNINSVNDTPYLGDVNPLKNSKQVFHGEPHQGPSLGEAMSTGPIKVKAELQSAHVNEVVEDKPCIDLIPVENIRIDPASSWMDPVGTSPYLIHLIPMFVGDIKQKMNTGEWDTHPEGMIKQALQSQADTTYAARTRNRQNPYDSDGKSISDYELAWVQRHIHRYEGEDYEFYTLGEVALLTQPQPLSQNVFHGMRPYVIGTCNLETHKVFPTSIAELGKGLQEEANDVVNQRLDNVKLALNKRFIVARNKQVDIGSLIRNVPGGITMVDNIDTDVREVSFPDVTQSSYAEQDRINVDMDELLGNFSAGSVSANRNLAETARGMSLLSQSTNVLVEYLLRTYVETFVEPVLKQLMKLEQFYETDQTVLQIAGAKAQAFQKYGVNQVTDDMLNHDMTLRVNVGMGATNPDQRVNKLVSGIGAFMNIAQAAQRVPVLNVQEVAKEIFGALGYDDGQRFINPQVNPQVAQLQAQVQQLTTALKTRSDLKAQDNQVKLKVNSDNNQAKVLIQSMKHNHESKKLLAQAYIDHMKAQDYTQFSGQGANQGQPPEAQ